MQVQDNQQLYIEQNDFQVTNCRLNAVRGSFQHNQGLYSQQNNYVDQQNINKSQIQYSNSSNYSFQGQQTETSFQIYSQPQQAEVKSFEQLERVQISNFNDLAVIKQELSNKQNWNKQFEAMQIIRSILKYHPEEVNNIYEFYGDIIVSIFQSNRTLMIKSCLALLSETFNLARSYQLKNEIIQVFLKLLFQKLQNNTLKALDEWIKYVIKCFALNLFDYDSAYLTLIQIPVQQQKKIQINEILEFLLEQKKNSINHLQSTTFVVLITFLSENINMSTNKKLQGPHIKLCISLIEKIGESCFVQLLQNTLSNEQMQNVVESIQSYIKSMNTQTNQQKK
ncbi:hypothetical protein ABPG72_000058 [Tetrahymena utriculariae]